MTTRTTMTREQAIRALRRKLLEMTDDDHSMSRVASEKGIYCRGFRQLTDAPQIEHDTCSGWDGVSDAELIRFHRELLLEEIQITR